ncbi:class I SAM-dependent methyltransferase [Caloranaerobacter ferrireducens]|uniref:class I SAM-dependent methyltransferase n=1 Tax=Caloranaerobacter ferrireducens TaxID=1323370 RepID=UPI00084D42B8|nr:class I SAM-dependent methyltransferase [Caloranaerobacter ferrireducens]
MSDNRKNVEEILEYYNKGIEADRLQCGIGKIEFERTKDIISRYLSKEKLVIYDIGGGAGTYSRWLAKLGHEVHLFDLSPKLVEIAKEKSKNENENNIYKIEVADARRINRPDESADIVLLMGPLYHLTERKERLLALKEAKRVLKEEGIVIIAAITRFGSTLYGLSVYGQKNNLIEEDEFMEMIERELTDGQHIRPEKYPGFIARAYFHLPDELANEIKEVGLEHEKNIAVEGPIWIVPAFEEKWSLEDSRKRMLKIARMVEEEKSIMGMSPHFIAIARKKQN